MTDFYLLKTLCSIHAPSGGEGAMKDFLLNYIKTNASSWNTTPKILQGPELQDCILLVFGKPRTAVFAHIDSIGFTVRYENQLVPIGGPEAETGYKLSGTDHMGPIECTLEVQEGGHLFYKFGRGIARGTSLTFMPDFREDEEYVQCCYLDNRLGVYNALKLAEVLEDGIIAFSCWEEHGGGSVPMLAKIIYEQYAVRQALISDITWVTEGVQPGKGVAVSMRDRNIPRQTFIQKIIREAEASGTPFQLEVEASGSSDGRELQASPYPFDWCFVGAPEQNVHSPDEKVHKRDIEAMINLYRHLMKEL